MLAARLIAVRNVDRVIALKFPAYYVQHEHKVLWLLHQFRQAYELRGTSLDDLGGSSEARTVAESVARADNAYLRQAKHKHIFTNSSRRLRSVVAVQRDRVRGSLPTSTRSQCL